MNFRYPNGQNTTAFPTSLTEKKQTKQAVNFGKRGMTLEEELNQSNTYYLTHDIAVIHKKPTPIQIVKVDYPKRSAAVIKEAYFRQASTTDYNGVYQGYYLDFEAKETKNKTAFPLKNFHQHQIDHMASCRKQGGLCFVIIRFTQVNRLFLLEADHLTTIWSQQEQLRKSITLAFLEQHGYEMQYGVLPIIPYIEVVDQIIQKLKE